MQQDNLSKPDLDHLKRQREWSYIVTLLRRDLYRIHESMSSTSKSGDELRVLAAKAEIIQYYLERALEKPEE